MRYYIFDLDWEFAVSQALLEAFDHDVQPGTKIGEVTEAIQKRAREIYKEHAQKNPKPNSNI